MRSHEKHIDKVPDSEEVRQSIGRYEERKQALQVRDAMQQMLLNM